MNPFPNDSEQPESNNNNINSGFSGPLPNPESSPFTNSTPVSSPISGPSPIANPVAGYSSIADPVPVPSPITDPVPAPGTILEPSPEPFSEPNSLINPEPIPVPDTSFNSSINPSLTSDINSSINPSLTSDINPGATPSIAQEPASEESTNPLIKQAESEAPAITAPAPAPAINLPKKKFPILPILIVILMLTGLALAGIFLLPSLFKPQANNYPRVRENPALVLKTSVCTKPFHTNGLTSIGGAKSAADKLILSYRSNEIESIEANLDATYENEAAARIGLAQISKTYNEEWARLGFEKDPLTTSYTVTGSNILMKQVADIKSLKPKASKLLRLDFGDVLETDIDKVQKRLKNSGFSCQD